MNSINCFHPLSLSFSLLSSSLIPSSSPFLRYNPVSMRYYAPTHMGKEGMVCFSPSPYLQDPEWQKEDETFRNSLTDTRLVQRVTYRNALIRVGKSLSVLDGFSITQEDKDQALEFLQWLAQPGEEGEEGRQMKREKGKEKDRITGSFDPSPMNLSFRNSFTRPGLSSSASTVGASPRLGRSSQSSSRENPSSARMSHRSSDATSSSPARASHRPSNSVSESQRAPLSPST
ncbi:MAG: hypothetical protein DHS80DRAFT_25927 [Piptocephalis tieghemiana]|nr:MAG: hypothetical protein DHS80DRAFT_25927 [Piptocephalis tieghemiana]